MLRLELDELTNLLLKLGIQRKPMVELLYEDEEVLNLLVVVVLAIHGIEVDDHVGQVLHDTREDSDATEQNDGANEALVIVLRIEITESNSGQ